MKQVSDDAGQLHAHVQYDAICPTAFFGLEEEGDRRFAAGRRFGALTLLGHRPYDAETERFLGPDPVDTLVNGYAYAHANPIHFTDPGGRFPVIALGFGASMLFGGAAATQLVATGSLLGSVAVGLAGAAAGATAFNFGLQVFTTCGQTSCPHYTLGDLGGALLPLIPPSGPGRGRSGGGPFVPAPETPPSGTQMRVLTIRAVPNLAEPFGTIVLDGSGGGGGGCGGGFAGVGLGGALAFPLAHRLRRRFGGRRARGG